MIIARSLLNCCQKLITKLLANRLQKLIPRINHRNQYRFFKDRSVQHYLAWAFKYIHKCQVSHRSCFLLKLDFAKAFDTIEHEPMIQIMRNICFNDKWLQWIGCIFSSGSSVELSMDCRADSSPTSVGLDRVNPCRR